MKTVIFDLDGTLADTSGDLIEAANASFRRLGLGDLLDPEADKLTAFHGARAMLRLGFGRVDENIVEKVELEYPNLLRHYADNIHVHTHLYPGAREAVEALSFKGYRLGICTNKPVEMAEDLVTRLGLREEFHSLVGAGSLPVSKPDPAPYRLAVERAGGDLASSLIVGDTATDASTARAVGVPSILVGFGPEGSNVARHGADAVLDSFDLLSDLVEELLS